MRTGVTAVWLAATGVAVAAIGHAPSLLAQAPFIVPVGIPGVIAAGAPATLVTTGYSFTEGPLPLDDGGLYFVDSMAGKVFHLSAGGRVTLQRDGTEGLNGQAFDRRGRRLAAVGGAKQLVLLDRAGAVVGTLSTGVSGTPLMTPNDVIAHSAGPIYFTDPGPPANTRGSVYWITRTGETRLLSDRVEWPNGIQLSPDERTLYVDDTHGDAITAFALAADGTPGEARHFARLQGFTPGKGSGADGMAVDREGRLYVTSSAGLQVFSPRGTHLGTITLPGPAANIAFGGPGKRQLFVMARQHVYRIPMLAAGPSRPGK